MEFTDTNTEEPLPSNEFAVTLKRTDTKSNRYLYQLAPLEPHTDETEYSSLPVIQGTAEEEAVRAAKNMLTGGLLNTPVADGLKLRTTHHGQRRMNGKALETLSVGLLPTPKASDNSTGIGKNDQIYLDGHIWRRQNGVSMRLSAMANRDLLPTPKTMDGHLTTEAKGEIINGRRVTAKGESFSLCLTDLAQRDMLPTPEWMTLNGGHLLQTPRTMEVAESPAKKAARCQDRTDGKWANLASMAEYGGFQGVTPQKAISPLKTDGEISRLSPLFTEEMMGFPLMWTTLPFLSTNGETNPSKPTEMQSSHK
jgi:hypothetical protein